MSETHPAYTLHPEAPGTEPAGFSRAADAALQQIDADEVLAYLRKRRGNVFLVAAVELLDSRAATVRALTMRADSAGYMTPTAEVVALRQQLAEATRELEYERQMRAETEKAMSTLAGRVKEQQAELAEQEVLKFGLIKEIDRLKNTLKA